ncbi:hypothetical protein BN7_2521 [Wickerhamomyces ciferrii]|uniref:EKC/KEOPS complex subunit GON7 n=1 Tax=Wickerhamomyces ciferrii (strain ATCC 14091 / BCRC 22168 / CBS 111 / JCM 3599 / NBRC 0793 / NRRL Y-1031 F-60-10) TaxID=1206466 RepID=K0KCZ2_WICCF|nr:uncharacterized protein BN7_2521 [Wickerhamomyces ciferrii]CCH42975.1 hypothetical protein BN7_2521 [Wickerhamomyces ciferrii]
MSTPSAIYSNPSTTKHFTINKTDKHTTNGKTTGPSQFVLDAGIIDKDQPSTPNQTYLGDLRSQVTTLQDDLNEFLTERMQRENSIGKEEEWEKTLLDGGE